jgi:hypothetical protein
MPQFRTALAPILIAVAAPAAGQESDPLRFFEGRTENDGTAKVIFHKPYKTHTVGRGRIERDGSLTLVQHIDDEGKPPHVRRWQVRRTGPGRYTATLSDAEGPVTIERVGEAYRFRFRMKGNLGVEQWLTPLPGGTAARCSVKVRKFGVTVGTSECMIRKVAEK